METLSHWSYSAFRSHLQNLTDGPQALISSVEYPERIDISQDWHEVLDNMRYSSQDGLERWLLVGYQNPAKSIYLQTAPVVGLEDRIKGHQVVDALRRAKQAGLTNMLGAIHSHPSELFRERTKYWGLRKYKEKVGNVADLSPWDLYWMVDPNRFLPLNGVVEGNDTIFAFKTRESTNVPAKPLFDQDTFVRYWCSQGLSVGKISQAIAQAHKLVYYRFGSGEQLVKTFSPVLGSKQK